MATKKDATTQTVSGMRRCIGSTTFGIEPHEAPLDDFPAQPSRRDGLGLMCREHWTAYTRGLARARRERHAGTTVPAHEHTLAASLVGEGQPIETAGRGPRRTRNRRPLCDHPVDAALVAAKALVDQVDALPADQMARRVGDDDVQAALAAIASGHGAPAETPLGEAIDPGTEEADAA